MAGTITEVEFFPIEDGWTSTVGAQLKLKCTSHTDNAFSVAIPTLAMSLMHGMSATEIISEPDGVTATTNNTDLEISENGLIILGAATKGLNFLSSSIKQASVFESVFLAAAKNVLVNKQDAWTITTSNNAVASAIFYLYIKLVRVN